MELQSINHITYLEKELIIDYSIFVFVDQKCGTLCKSIKSAPLKVFKDNMKKRTSK